MPPALLQSLARPGRSPLRGERRRRKAPPGFPKESAGQASHLLCPSKKFFPAWDFSWRCGVLIVKSFSRERGGPMEDNEFAAAVRRYTNTVYRIALHSCKNPADAEDIVQNVFLKLYRTPTDFESEEHLRRWVIRVAVNESKKLVCSAWFRKSVPLEDYAQTLEFAAPEESSLFLAVMELPKRYRVPVYLYYYEGYPAKEAAALCGIKVSTMQTRLQRAREKLKKKLCDGERENIHEN